jgi:hypothetical protein
MFSMNPGNSFFLTGLTVNLQYSVQQIQPSRLPLFHRFTTNQGRSIGLDSLLRFGFFPARRTEGYLG